MKNILVIGHYNSTGGVSIHLRRLVDLLRDDFEVNVIDESRLADSDGKTFNLRNKDFVEYFKLIIWADIIYIHTTISFLRFFHILVGTVFFKKVIVTVHSLSLIKTKVDLFFLKSILKLPSKIIVVSKEIHNKLRVNRAEILEAFLPPVLKKEDDLPKEITDILKTNKKKRIIIGNAFRLNFHKGEDLYGLDLLLEVAAQFKRNGNDIKIIFILTTLEVNRDIYENYLSFILDKKLSDQIRIITYPVSFVKLIERADLVVRPTNTDGDALTVREALFFNKPVIASDVVCRPKGTILFANRNSKDLYDKIIDVFSLNKFYESNNFDEFNNLSRDYKRVYKKILS